MPSNKLFLLGVLAAALTASLLIATPESHATIDVAASPTTDLSTIQPPESPDWPRGVCHPDFACRKRDGNGCTSGASRTDENDIQAFNEEQHRRLSPGMGRVIATAPSPKYGGNTAGGALYDLYSDAVSFWVDDEDSVVNSHFVHRHRLNAGTDTRTITLIFQEDIIGTVISETYLDGSDLIVGNEGTCYPAGAGRGPDFQEDGDYVKYFATNPKKVEIRFVTGSSLDQVRVITEGNRAPVTTDDSVTSPLGAPVGGAVLANDADADGTTLTAAVTVPPLHGSLLFNSNGTFTYTRTTPGYSGIDIFKYNACDPGMTWVRTAVTHTTLGIAPGAPESALCDEGTVTVNICPNDMDCDGYLDPQATVHQGPANTSTAVDNCPTIANNPQTNTDGNFIDNSPPYMPTVDDKTLANSDALGDACDSDDDNDGLPDTAEASLAALQLVCPTAITLVTDPLKLDTDGDRSTDGAECAMGSDPGDGASKPAIPTLANDPDKDLLSTAFEMVIGTNPALADTDADGIPDGYEFKGYGSNPSVVDTDGDGVRDRCEIASLNGDNVVNSGDQSAFDTERVRNVSLTGIPKLANFDVNKDGAYNAGDRTLIDTFAVPGKCP